MHSSVLGQIRQVFQGFCPIGRGKQQGVAGNQDCLNISKCLDISIYIYIYTYGGVEDDTVAVLDCAGRPEDMGSNMFPSVPSDRELLENSDEEICVFDYMVGPFEEQDFSPCDFDNP